MTDNEKAILLTQKYDIESAVRRLENVGKTSVNNCEYDDFTVKKMISEARDRLSVVNKRLYQ